MRVVLSFIALRTNEKQKMDKLEYVVRLLGRGTNKKYENYVINAIYQKVNNPNLIIETQKEIKLEDGYRPLIDLFLPQLNIAIEVDEGYHASEKQHKHDIRRERSINSQVSKSCFGEKIQFERVIAYNVSFEEINSRIDEVVKLIKDKLDSRTIPILWKSNKEMFEDIKKRGLIDLDDCFDSNFKIINLVYDCNYKTWRKACYRLLWFPVMSDKNEDDILTNCASWENFFNSTHSIIYERSINSFKNKQKKKDSVLDKQNETIRVVFVKDRDSFGKTRKRFAGVFKAGGWDDNLNAQIWKLVSTSIKIPINEEIIKSL